MTKIVPSPDWFIGLDSLDLCSQGAFRQTVTIEVRGYHVVSLWVSLFECVSRLCKFVKSLCKSVSKQECVSVWVSLCKCGSKIMKLGEQASVVTVWVSLWECENMFMFKCVCVSLCFCTYFISGMTFYRTICFTTQVRVSYLCSPIFVNLSMYLMCPSSMTNLN